MKLSAFYFIIGMLISTSITAQHRSVKGRIVDQETGQVLQGASILVKQKNVSTVANGEGEFTISAETGDVLLVSYVGYGNSEFVINENVAQTIQITLMATGAQLSNLVVTGALGIRRAARELGGGAQVVSNESINQGKTVNPIFGLSSKVAGLRINMYDSKVDPAVQVALRGTRSLSRTAGIDGRNPNAPIYVVDGVSIPDINRLNPNDIESITVLKGANAAALYGSEGVNGAIMITTKSGKKGRGVVTFSNTIMFSKVFALPPAQTRYGQGTEGIYDPIQWQSWGPEFDGTMKDFGTPLPNGTQPQLLYAAGSGDNRKDLFQTGITNQTDVSFSGSNENSTYFLSVQHVAANGIIPKDKNNRTGIRLNSSRKFGKLNTSYNINYIYNKKNTTPDGPWITAYQLPANFDYNSMKDWEDPNSVGNPLNFFTDAQKNPFFQIDNYRDASTQQTLNGKLQFDYEFNSWFSALYRLGYYSVSDETRSTVGKFQAPGSRNVNGSVSDGNNNYRRLVSDLILSFNKQFGKLSTRLLAGQNLRSDYRKQTSIGSNNLLYPEVFNPGSRTGELNGSATITQQRSAAVYGELTTGYDNFLFVTLTGRNDWVSVLSRENRSFFYPGVSTSFVFTDAFESLKGSHLLSFGKVFASWNKTGNVTLAPYQLNNTYSQINGFPFGNTVGFVPSTTNPNPNIEPEFVSSYEAGVQLSFLRNRLHFEGSYIYSNSQGQIFNATTSSATGYSSARVNAGRVANNIVELSVNGDIIKKKSLKWNVGFNYTHTNNQVKELYAGLQSINNFRQSYAVIGQALPSLMVSDYKRDDQGRVVVDKTTGDPLIASEQRYLGTLVPPYLMGLNTLFQYKGISVGMQFDWRMGGWLYSEIVPRMYAAGTDPRTAQYDRQPFVWPHSVIETEPGKYVENTGLKTSGGGAAFWSKQGEVQINTAAKSDFIKLRELNIHYSIPMAWLGNQRAVSMVDIGFVANNLFLIRHKDNVYGDPEYLYNNTDGYLSFRQVPPYRSMGVTVNVTF